MPLLRSFNKKIEGQIALRKTEKTLKLIMENIELLKGGFNIEKIYDCIGDGFLKIGLSSLIAICDIKKDVVIVKKYYAVNEHKEVMEDIIENELTNKNIPAQTLAVYQTAFTNGSPYFYKNRCKDLRQRYPQHQDLFAQIGDFASIVCPLMLKGEMLGAIEIFSTELNESYLNILDEFIKNLAKTIANNILFQEIKRSAGRYLDLFENAKEGYLVFDNNRKSFIETNQEISHISGYTKDELKQISYLHLFDPEERKMIQQKVNDFCENRRLLDQGENIIETKILTKNNQPRNINLIFNKTKNDAEWFLIVRDITEKKKAEKELKESERKYSKLVNNALEVVITINKSGKITFANKAFLNMSGYDKDQSIGSSIASIIHEHDREKTMKKFFAKMEGEKAEKYGEFRSIAINDRSYVLQYSTSKILENNKIIGLQIIGRDITEQKKLEIKIKNAKDHYEQVIDAIPDSICVIDSSWQIVSCNRVFAENVDIPIEKIIKNDFKKIISRYHQNLLAGFCCVNCTEECIVNKALVNKRAYEEEHKIIDKYNQPHFYRMVAFPKRLEHNDNEQIIYIINDITEKRLAEEKIEQLNKLNQRILDTSPISIVVLDKNGTAIAANKLAKKLMDKTDSPIIGRQLTETKEIISNETIKSLYANLFAKGEPFYYDGLPYKLGASDETRHLNIVAVPLLDTNGQVEGAISMAIDNTEAVVARQKLKESNLSLEKKVEDRTAELATINEQLNNVLELKQKFISDSSHELRTPLTVIQGNIDLATQEMLNSRKNIPEVFKLIKKEVEHMTNILTDLTLLTNADANTEKMKYERVDLTLLVKAVAESLTAIAQRKKIKLKFENEIRPIYAMGDESKLERVLLNIVRNAIKYTNNNGWIKISLKQNQNEICVKIKDNGIGIPKKDLPNIFERFYRVDKARSRAEGGTGLGLAIAKWIVEAHNGHISVESKLGEGSTFTVHLPYRKK